MHSDPGDIRVLYVDSRGDGNAAATALADEGARFGIETASDAESALARLEAADFECVVSAYELPDRDGIEFLEAVRDRYPDVPFVLCAAAGSEAVASAAVSADVTEYVGCDTADPEAAPALADHVVSAVETHPSTRRRRRLHTYERMINSMREAACVYDAEGRFRLVNEYLAEWYGETPADLEGERSALIPHIREGAEGDPYRELLDGDREELSGELEGEFPGRGEAVLEYRLTPLAAPGTEEAVVGVARDITERKERERELEQARAEYRDLFDGMNDAAWVLDPDEETFLAVNDAAVERTEFSRAELLSMGPHDIDVEHDDGAITERIEGMADDEIRVFETVRETKGGERIPVEISAGVITYRGEPAILAVSRDISERKQREKQLEQFASVVSHDLRNPLQVSKGHLRLAVEEVDDGALETHLRTAIDAHDRMNALIENLLTLAREGQGIGDVEPIDLEAFAEGCWRNVDTEGATLFVDAPPRVCADRSRLKQLIENLIRNAVEHGGADTTITVGGLGDGFYLADDGPGIPPDEREDVFEAGYSTKGGGTGFGLSIVERIAHAHEWDIHVEEGPEGGARFEITGVAFPDPD